MVGVGGGHSGGPQHERHGERTGDHHSADRGHETVPFVDGQDGNRMPASRRGNRHDRGARTAHAGPLFRAPLRIVPVPGARLHLVRDRCRRTHERKALTDET
ncbi:hypothetical protein GCM10027445_40560 [Amycolatopsis endophytica]